MKFLRVKKYNIAIVRNGYYYRGPERPRPRTIIILSIPRYVYKNIELYSMYYYYITVAS